MDGTESELIYENVGGNSDELERAIRVCLMGGDIHLPLTCTGKSQLSDAIELECVWEAWRCSLFIEVLAPHLVSVFTAAHRGDAKTIVALDRALSGNLAPEVAVRSALAGCQFHASMDGAQHVKALDKLHQAVLRQEIDGHHATFFASEAAVFNVPMMHVLPAYLFAEWRSARLLVGIPSSGSSIEVFQSDCQKALADAQHVFSTIAGGEDTLSVCA